MDKRATPRAPADSKKQDVSNKPWPRSSKKREPSSNAVPKDVSRKQFAQRGKSFDKRPKPRGAYHGSPLGGKTDPWLENDNAEVGSVFVPGSKKQNLNHLLNFHYEPRESNRQPLNKGNRKHGLVYTNTHKHNKELFLQSNCQFVVKAGGDYSSYFVDPDIPVRWEIIEQINVRVNEPLSCPICLCETVAGRITRCGHTYCWPCLLHYFALSESSSRPCPICFQPIDKIHLKSVQGIWQNYIPVGENIRMTLMRRLRGSTMVEAAPPLNTHDLIQNRERLPSISELELSSLFSKLLTASPHEVAAIISRERAELNAQLSPDLEHPQFILEALHLLKLREENLILSTDSNGMENTENKNYGEETALNKTFDSACAITEKDDELTSFTDSASACSSDLQQIDNENCVVTAYNKPLLDKYFYFYQAADGQTTFLHGINIRIIEATYGSLSLAPRELHGIILERASGSVDSESRRRLRYLQHLSIHCPYDLVEIQLQPPYVTQEALDLFKGDMDDRKRQRQRRARDEKRREKVIMHQERIIMGHIPELEVNINSEEHFPAYQPGADLSPPSDWKWDRESNGSSPGPSSLPKHDNSLSFAKMASTAGTWKIRQTPVAPAPSNVTAVSENSDDEGAPPAYNVSLSEAISEALLTSLNSHNDDNNHPKDGKKKKKYKPKVLFTTGIQHRTSID